MAKIVASKLKQIGWARCVSLSCSQQSFVILWFRNFLFYDLFPFSHFLWHSLLVPVYTKSKRTQTSWINRMSRMQCFSMFQFVFQKSTTQPHYIYSSCFVIFMFFVLIRFYLSIAEATDFSSSNLIKFSVLLICWAIKKNRFLENNFKGRTFYSSVWFNQI